MKPISVPELIGSIQRTALEQVRGTVVEWRGSRFFDLRTYYMDTEGEWRPTKKGM